MIDGVYPSQFVQVEAMRTSHYRNLKDILNKSLSRMSWLSPQYKKIELNKKLNHTNWRIFNRNEQQSMRYKKNTQIYDRLKRISSEDSCYGRRKEQNSRDKLLHHNYIYECDRRYQSIQRNNRFIISRLSNAKSQFNHQQLERQFKLNQSNVTRLEKFQRVKRLNRIVSSNLKLKFLKTSNNFKPNLHQADSQSHATNPQSHQTNPQSHQP